MKNKITLILVCFVFIGSLVAQERNCSTMENLEYRMQKNPKLARNMARIETFTQNKVAEMQSNRIDGNIITLPVVVHVLYRNSTENITVAQIQSQLDVLNEDFRRTNPDADNVWSQAADTEIQFCLATVDPNGNTTTGITRKSTTRQDWGTNDAMKSSATGGIDPWNTAEYLNMWVVPRMTSGGRTILGYAQFPGGDPTTDGVVMGYNYFGRVGAVSAPFDGGRTTTHEVGHYLNLRHIWGDSNCGNDFVADTPTHQTANSGCPSGRVSCGSTDMYQNYMDYSNDVCMNLFTQGQKDRMRAQLAPGGFRRSLALSDKCSGGGTNPTCSDGIQNGDETGIDCGGSSCAPCSNGPQYCASNGQSVADEYISRVQLNTINNTSGAASSGYADFTNVSTNLTKGQSYTITVTPTWTGTLYNEAYAVWIDYNRDGDFTDAGEQVFSQAPTQASPVSGSFTVPSSASEVETRMRVSMKYNAAPTACESFQYGEVEDYTIIIEGAAPDTVAPVITLIGSATINIDQGDNYTDAGATATDNVDGNLTSSIVVSGSVNTNVPGTYTLTYNVSDAAGNAATPKTRTVTVNGVSGGGSCSNGVSLPYSEGFENGIGAWSQSSADDLNWTVDANGTPSNNTGPSSAAQGSNYIYVEASGNNTGYPNKRAIITSPCFDLSSVSQATISFKYHMFGSTNAGSITLEVSDDDGAIWTSLWSQTGNQGNQWLTVEVDLASYVGSSIQLRFNRLTGGTWQADVAIDDISVSDGGSTPPADCSSLNFNDYTIRSFSNQDNAGNNSVGNGGASLTLTNNTWKYIDFPYTVTANTVIELEFSSTSEGEIHGIGFENDNSLTSSFYFKFYGTQNYGVTNFDNYTSGTRTYIIPVGDSYTGAMDRLVFINDNDAGSGNNSTFANVKIYETSCSGSARADIVFGNRVDVLGDEDENNLKISIYPNPVEGNILNIETNAQNLEYSVINMLGQEVAKGNSLSKINVSNLDQGMYLIKFSIGDVTEIRRFIKK